MKRQKRYISVLGFLFGLAALPGLLGGCATLEPKKPPAMVPTDRGTVVYLEKYEFKRPPEGWALMRNVEGGDFELGFMRIEKGDFPTQTTFMYDEQPYGSSRDLEKTGGLLLHEVSFQQRDRSQGHEARKGHGGGAGGASSGDGRGEPRAEGEGEVHDLPHQEGKPHRFFCLHPVAPFDRHLQRGAFWPFRGLCEEL